MTEWAIVVEPSGAELYLEIGSGYRLLIGSGYFLTLQTASGLVPTTWTYTDK